MVLITEHPNLSEPTLVGYIDNRPEQKVRRLASVFPEQPVFDLDVAYNVMDKAGIKAASIIGLDAGTPIRTKGEVQSRMASLTKVAHAYTYTETELFKYRKARDNAEQNQIVLNAVQEIGDLYEGVEDIKEYMRAQIAYNGKFKYEDPKTETKLEFDLDLPEGSIVERDIYSNPLEAIQAEVDAFKDANRGQAPDFMVMNSKTYAKLKRNSVIKSELYGDADRLVRNSDLAELLTELELPQITIDDTETIIEGIDEDLVYKHLDDDKIVFHKAVLGNTFTGPALENNFQTGTFIKNVVDEDPHTEKTIVGEVTFPVLKEITGVRIVTLTPEAEEETP